MTYQKPEEAEESEYESEEDEDSKAKGDGAVESQELTDTPSDHNGFAYSEETKQEETASPEKKSDPLSGFFESEEPSQEENPEAEMKPISP